MGLRFAGNNIVFADQDYSKMMNSFRSIYSHASNPIIISGLSLWSFSISTISLALTALQLGYHRRLRGLVQMQSEHRNMICSSKNRVIL